LVVAKRTSLVRRLGSAASHPSEKNLGIIHEENHSLSASSWFTVNPPISNQGHVERELRPGDWVALDADDNILACRATPEELDRALLERGVAPASVFLAQVPLDDEGFPLGGVEIEMK
jgi:hypothetical protein